MTTTNTVRHDALLRPLKFVPWCSKWMTQEEIDQEDAKYEAYQEEQRRYDEWAEAAGNKVKAAFDGSVYALINAFLAFGVFAAVVLSGAAFLTSFISGIIPLFVAGFALAGCASGLGSLIEKVDSFGRAAVLKRVLANVSESDFYRVKNHLNW